MKKINITSGQELNKIYQDKEGTFIPFNEAMIKGSYTSSLFSDDFIKERAKVHQVSEESYRNTMKDFLTFISSLDEYEDVTLWFGYEPFCQANTKTILRYLKEHHYKGKLHLNLVNEYTGGIQITSDISLTRAIQKIEIEMISQSENKELKDLYENEIDCPCEYQLHSKWISKSGEKPENFCESAWISVAPYIYLFSIGGYNLHNHWMKNENQAVVSCNDGIRPASFLINCVFKEGE